MEPGGQWKNWRPFAVLHQGGQGVIADLLPWLNLLLVPAVGLLLSINSRLARLEATQAHHGNRLERLDGIKA